MIFIVVDFPAQFGPIIQIISPFSIVADILKRTFWCQKLLQIISSFKILYSYKVKTKATIKTLC